MVSQSSQTDNVSAVVNPADSLSPRESGDNPKPQDEQFQEAIENLHRKLADLTQENVELKEAVAARNIFIAVAAHELKNGMTPVLGRVDFLRHMAAGMSLEKLESYLDNIVWLVGVFSRRATTLLDVSRMTSGKLKVDRVKVDGIKIIEDVTEGFRPFAERAGSSLTLDLPHTPVDIIGDRLSLEQVIDNLVSNAIKYGNGQPIVVSARKESNGFARFTVRDGGPGISTESQARIFERFERAVLPGTHAGGFGIGLWVVKQLVDAMDGTIEISSSPGAGATFCVTLPLHAEKETE